MGISISLIHACFTIPAPTLIARATCLYKSFNQIKLLGSWLQDQDYNFTLVTVFTVYYYCGTMYCPGADAGFSKRESKCVKKGAGVWDNCILKHLNYA